MNDKLIRPLNREIIAALAEREGFSLSGRRVAAALTKAPGWTEGLSALLPIRERLSCAQVLEDYDEPYPGARERVRRGLQVIVTAYASARLKTEAERMLKSLDE